MKKINLPDMVKILVLGRGGREHALVWKLAQSPRVIALWCAPGNIGMTQEHLLKNGEQVRCVSIDINDAKTLIEFARQNGINLVVIGPEAPFFSGVADRLRDAGFLVWGPNKAAASLEKSKKFFQRFAVTYGVPAPFGHWFTKVGPAMDFARQFDYKVAVKADGPCGGKGVDMCSTEQEVRAALTANILEGRFNGAGKCTIVQKRMFGQEVSLHAILDASSTIVPFASCKDHKHVEDGENGLLGGGSGTISPHPFLNYATFQSASRQVLAPLQNGCIDLGIEYCGPIFPGLMLTPQGPAALECNVRMGDPETQVYMVRLKSDLVGIIERSFNGTLNPAHLKWDKRVAVCVIMMAKGYPISHARQKGEVILGLKEVLEDRSDVKVFCAGVSLNSELEYTVDDGRVLGVTALADTLDEARGWVYGAVEYIDAASKHSWAHFRKDIGGKPLFS